MKNRRGAIVVLVLGLLPLTSLLGAGHLLGFRVNLTPSYPLGVWRIAPLEREVRIGDLVFICPPQAAEFELARERGYVRSGLCPGWFSPLIKTVKATAGQQVQIGLSIVIDGAPLAHSDILAVDAEGRGLAAYAGGSVPSGQLFLHSDFAGSYDSRYFGPIPSQGILGLAVPILTLGP